MAAHKMILLPADPGCAPVEVEALAARLQAIDLIGAAQAIGAQHFYPTGEHFLQLVTFLGCSPNIELEPPADPDALETASQAGSFCHVFLDSGPRLRFRGDGRCPAPRCPACRQPLADWPMQLARWQETPAQDRWHCTHCHADGALETLGFRKCAGFARSFVEIRGIYPSEAVPGDALLQALQGLTGCPWNTIYIKE